MRFTPGRLLTATAIAIVATISLGACAQSEPDAAPAPPLTTPTSSAPDATASADAGSGAGAAPAPGAPGSATPPQSTSPAAEATPVDLVDFATQDGRMRVRIPAGWTVDDMSSVAVLEDGTQRWRNSISFQGADGSRLFYTDRLAAGGHTVWGDVVEERRLEQGGTVTARVWESSEGDHLAYVDTAAFGVEGLGSTLHSMHFGFSDTVFDTRAEAEAFIASPPVQLALDVMQTLRIVGDDDALPDGIGVEHEGTTYLPYTTRNGTATFLVPLEWTIRDSSGVGTDRAGRQVWNNSVSLELLPVGPVLHYGDMEFTNLIEEWEWTLGEVRPTQTDGWQAVSWTLGDSVPNNAGDVGVSLTDRGGAVRPADTVCSERMCRSFSSLPTPPHWYREEGLDGPEDFFGSATEERLLTVVASLETHHDDATRMP